MLISGKNPFGVSIGRSIKSNVRNQFENWLVENYDFIVRYNEQKKKYKFMAPNKNLIVEWVLKAFQEVDPNLVKKSTVIYSFDLAGITDEAQRDNIVNNKLKDLCVAYDIEEYVNIEKQKICAAKSFAVSDI